MSVAITIRDVPDGVRDELAARAAREGKSLQQYTRQLLIETTARPTQAEAIARIRERAEKWGKNIPADVIIESIREGRR